MGILNKLTVNYLKLNRKRTIVTIIGIILTGAMISGITTLAASFQDFLIRSERESSGNWDASFNNIKYANVKYIENNDKFKEVFLTKELGSAKLSGEDKKTFDIREYDTKSMENFHIKLIDGELPKNSDELAISKTFFDKNATYKVGDRITLKVGNRKVHGKIVKPSVTIEESKEEFEILNTKTYKICGIIEIPRFQRSEDCPGMISFLNKESITENDVVNANILTKNVNNIYKDIEDVSNSLKLYEEDKIDYNKYVLMYYGVSGDTGFVTSIYLICAILILVVGIGSVLVIYNSFAISVSERKKQFGMLSSVGATKKQIKKMVLTEGAILGVIGIPLGILTGILGIGITLNIVNGLMKPMFADGLENLNLELIVSYPALLIAVVLIALTIYLSVIVPARRASKISPIDAIRQTDDIKVKAKKLRTPKFLRNIYGIEGDIALKNLKRSKKRYRTTVLSLIISIVLFITFNGFVTYTFMGFNALYLTLDCDAQINLYEGDETLKNQVILELEKISNMKNYSIVTDWYGKTTMSEENLDGTLKKLIQENETIRKTYDSKDGIVEVGVEVIKLNNKEYEKYLKKVGLTKLDNNECVLVNYVDGTNSVRAEFNISKHKQGENIKIASNVENEMKTLDLKIAKVTDKLPFGVMSWMGNFIIVVNEDTFSNVTEMKAEYIDTTMFIKTENAEEVCKAATEILEKYSGDNYYLANIQEQMKVMENLKLIIEIFLYGFIILISAIGISNIFNTISTNINLRRREFANLKSMGMTDKSFNRMLNLECIFYGTKALFYGIPIGIILCYLLNKAFEETVTYIFKIPYSSIVISIVAVYLIVFLTMTYASGKVKKENIIDVLRDDNI